jgi:hypothetical protein
METILHRTDKKYREKEYDSGRKEFKERRLE